MRSRLPKVLHPILGRPMLAYVLDVAREATGERPLVVYSPATEQVRAAFADEADFALQDEPRGTGDALRAALDALTEGLEEIVVLSGDVPRVPAGYVRAIAGHRRALGAVMCLTAMEHRADGYGRVVTDPEGRVLRIVEARDASAEELAIRAMNMGVYAFEAAWLRAALPRLTASPATGELYLTQLVEIAGDDGRAVVAWEVPDDSEHDGSVLDGINDREELASAEGRMRNAIVGSWMRRGVTAHDPFDIYIEPTVELAEDVELWPHVVLRGTTRIGSGTVIRSGSEIVDSTVGERCEIWTSVLESATVGDDVRIGPFAHLRPGADVAQGAEVGNFAEIKKARLGARSKQHHFSYIGDAEVGADVNIGAGTITANYDGRAKHRTVIEDGVFIGSDTILRAPVTIGKDAATGAGSVVTRDVPPGKLAVGVPARIREKRQHDPERVDGG
jgi:bifunctional UDP-N-acetylglucosamine pyrophosphorylase/glucosamine-1-phosphate N-acetyltransferase